MSREKELTFEDPGSLSDDDLRYALERNMLSESQLADLGLDNPDKVRAVLNGDERPVNPLDRPYSGNHMVLTDEEIALIERRREKNEAAANAVETPAIKVPNAEADDEAEDYDEGWTNNERREELARRDLSVEGNKQELIDRLLESDRTR